MWDAAKLSSALGQGATEHAFLIAGAPVEVWERAGKPATVLADSIHSGATIITHYIDWWEFWSRDVPGAFPTEVPTPVVTAAGGSQIFGVPDGRNWEICWSVVSAPGDANVALGSLLAAARPPEPTP